MSDEQDYAAKPAKRNPGASADPYLIGVNVAPDGADPVEWIALLLGFVLGVTGTVVLYAFFK